MLKCLFGVILALLLSVNALPQVKLGKATLIGRDVSGTVEFFGGVPFAEPPLGPLRFEPPVLRTHLPPGTRNASSYGKACVPSVVIGEPPAFSEDCLFIKMPPTRSLELVVNGGHNDGSRGIKLTGGRDLVE
ncbi:hypothetical protein D9611_007310 [Ephemerocybe angulata]|uniref:Carboxylesterase type B domain-containing protein n=1 Tax=Ephemerocybe angulata TaxID=980116 RepID=A0A8H5FLF9_9AGAR|nr:hypothetical protein D9611_007310 [Tulosesus angulatus]